MGSRSSEVKQDEHIYLGRREVEREERNIISGGNRLDDS
jgi:hypothetical protein